MVSLAPGGYIANHTSSPAYAFTGEGWRDFYDQNPDFQATDAMCQEVEKYAEEHDLPLDEAWKEMQEKGGYEEEPPIDEEWEEEEEAAAAIEQKKKEEEDLEKKKRELVSERWRARIDMAAELAGKMGEVGVSVQALANRFSNLVKDYLTMKGIIPDIRPYDPVTKHKELSEEIRKINEEIERSKEGEKK